MFKLIINEIGPEGAKSIAEVLKTNTSLTQLSLGAMRLSVVKLHYLHTCGYALGNKIEPEGAKTIGEVLKTNSSLAQFDLG